ncbi:efflux RND transporter periplasmic adaptor subunit [Anaerocellum danielii]|uniref:Efflux RND transporter periplasmic adaptor subunit n=1 Tax=Anaerocellum danielii TaxID=1387557 RepID=A0ABZ0TYX9_9FIRM|nr:efflux RND transporter periplasmic adaptor subunit [Caldicellulosiruptor danielii]WPX08666.1 efflux RND transporter periplasmic adaptor subunit [Caldicellulosiruptor danielii]
MKRSLKGVIATVLILAIAVLIVYVISAKNKQTLSAVEVKTAKVEKGDIVSLFSTNGDVESKSKQDYYILSPTKVLKVYVELGNKVKKGDKLLELETQDLTLQYKIAQKQLEMAKLQLESLKKLKEKTSSQSTNSLNSQGISGFSQALPSTVTNSSISQNQSSQQLKSSLGGANLPLSSNAQQSSSQLSIPASSSGQLQSSSSLSNIDDQIKLQQKQVEIAELNLKSIKQSMNKQQRYITAGIDGIVTVINAKEGNYFASTQLPAIVVEDPDNLQIVLNVNQYDAVNLKEGQKAYVHFGNKIFDGIVRQVAPAATKVLTQTGSENVVKAYVDILNNDGTIKSGFNVDVDIKIGEKKDVVKVPSEAIVTDKNGKSYVYVVENGVAKQREVKPGLSSDLETEVLDGVSVGEEVILNPNSSIQDGTKVKVKGSEKDD